MKKFLTTILPVVFVLGIMLATASPLVRAQVNPDPDYSNPFSTKFRLVICDGPELPKSMSPRPGYIPCNFEGFMLQVQHLINIMISGGILLSVALFTWAGYLYITGIPGKISQAKEIFKKVFIGLLVMLSAWFIIYQILAWLVPNPAVRSLLGN